MYRIKFIRENRELEVQPGTTVLEAEREAGLCPDAPCGGQGKCGKCKVLVNGTEALACQTKVWQDLEVDTKGEASGYAILTKGLDRRVLFEPDLKQQRVVIDKPERGDNRSDWERLVSQLEEQDELQPDLTLASSLYERRKAGTDWYAVYTKRKILEINDREKKLYFAAFDIGTTTVVGYLLDAGTGQELSVKSRMNPQAEYGADVIMRANHALKNGIRPLTEGIQKAVDEMLQELAEEAGIESRDIYQVAVVGNTCMHHLFLGISPASLVHAPYNPAVRQGLILPAVEYGLHIHEKGELLLLPDIAGYVGADTCGCILALRPDRKEEMSLTIDIGTNGEMVLGNRERLVCCSTAAGPAFEGAKIECGMRGAKGAIDHVRYQDGAWTYTTVGGAAPIGLCGSGLIDLVAELRKAGFISENGHLESGQELASRFVLASPEASGNGKGVYLTQKDIGEVQLAKAAIAAGIRLLMEELSITENEIDAVYLAGAFGNYMNPESAAVIGMLPASLLGKIIPVGNAAGEGAKLALLNARERGEMDTLVQKIGFVELAISPEFQDCFVEELCFPEQPEGGRDD